MPVFSTKQQKISIFNLKNSIKFLISIGLIFCSTMPANAKQPTSLWTIDNILSRSYISMSDISSNGHYTLLKIIQFLPKGKEVLPLSQCVLVDNKTLKQEVIGTLNSGCSDPQFIGEGNQFAYVIRNMKNGVGEFILFVQDGASGNKTEVKKFAHNVDSYRFAPDGKSFLYMYTEQIPYASPRIVVDGSQEKKTNLYLQKLDKNRQPLNPPELLTHLSLTLSPPFQSHYAWSPDGQKIAFTTGKPVWKSLPHMNIHLYDLKTKKTNTILKGDYAINSIFFSRDGQKLAFLRNEKNGEQELEIKSLKNKQSATVPRRIQILDLKTKRKNEIFVPDILHFAGWKANNIELVVARQVGTKTQLCSLNSQTKTLTPMKAPHITNVDKITLSNNHQYIGFIGQNLHHPEEAYIADLNHFIPKKISAINDKIDLTSIHAHSLKWKSYDSLEVEGILVYPEEYKKGKKVPLVVLVPGGPGGGFLEEFIGNMWEANYSPALFSSLGYATLAVNYRGSSGYGKGFENLVYQDIGTAEVKDITSGVDTLIAQGIADPKQLFICGGSYGGFLSALAIAQTDRFKAAIIRSGIVDWITYISTTDYPVIMESFFGSYYWDDYKLWRKSSPLSYVDNVRTPTLLLHGKEDVRVPQIQSQQFYQALRTRKIPTRFVSYPGEEHSFGNRLVVKDAIEEMVNWLKQYGR